jgi:hypothetical protein
VLTKVDGPHPALAQHCDDPIASDRFPDHRKAGC